MATTPMASPKVWKKLWMVSLQAGKLLPGKVQGGAAQHVSDRIGDKYDSGPFGPQHENWNRQNNI